MWKCKFCLCQVFEPRKRGMHARNCLLNPNREVTIAKIALKLQRPKKQFTLQCKKCNSDFDLLLTQACFDRGDFRKHCSRKCASSHSREIQRKFVFDHEVLRREAPNAVSFNDLKLRCGIQCKSNARLSLQPILEEIGVEFSHLITRWTPERVLCHRPGQWKGRLKEALLKIGREYKCELCSQPPNWQGNELTLTVDHIDGDNENHEPQNLRFLCPNCHSQTDTFCGKNLRNRRSKNLPIQVRDKSDKTSRRSRV